VRTGAAALKPIRRGLIEIGYGGNGNGVRKGTGILLMTQGSHANNCDSTIATMTTAGRKVREELVALNNVGVDIDILKRERQVWRQSRHKEPGHHGGRLQEEVAEMMYVTTMWTRDRADMGRTVGSDMDKRCLDEPRWKIHGEDTIGNVPLSGRKKTHAVEGPRHHSKRGTRLRNIVFS